MRADRTSPQTIAYDKLVPLSSCPLHPMLIYTNRIETSSHTQRERGQVTVFSQLAEREKRADQLTSSKKFAAATKDTVAPRKRSHGMSEACRGKIATGQFVLSPPMPYARANGVHLTIGTRYYITGESIGRVDNSLFGSGQSGYHALPSRSIIGRSAPSLACVFGIVTCKRCSLTTELPSHTNTRALAHTDTQNETTPMKSTLCNLTIPQF